MSKWLLTAFALFIGGTLIAADVQAKRLGASRSVGAQRTAPPASTPAKPAQQQAAPATPAAPQPAPSGLSRWLPMLGGLALGGLLGSMFGGSGMGGLLLLALLAIGAVVAYKFLSRRRQEGPAQTMQYAGGGQETVRVPAAPLSSGVSAQSQTIPAGFDADGFLRGAKLNFVKLQVANDLGNLDEIREFTTADVFRELSKDVVAGRGAQQTDVVTLNADLLEVTTEGQGSEMRHWASVRFSGTVREAAGSAPEEFQEVWNLVKPADGSSGWLLAGIQQMQ